MLQHPIIRYLALSLSLAFASTSALAQFTSGVRPERYNARTQSIVGQFSEPPCPLTNAATVLVSAATCASDSTKGVGLNTITLAQNSVFAFPTGLPVGGNFQFGIQINHGTGPFTATFAPGYRFPAAQIVNGQPALSAVAGPDYIWCSSIAGSPPTLVDCSASMLAMTAATTVIWTRVAHTGCHGVAGCQTPAVDTTASGGADLIVVAINCVSATGPTPTDSVGTTYTGIGSYQTTSGIGNRLFYKQTPTTSATHTFANNCSSTANTQVEAWKGSVASPLDVAVGSVNGGSVTAFQPGATGALAQTNELIISAATVGFSTSPTADSGFTVSGDSYMPGSDNGGFLAYLAPDTTSSSINVTLGWTNGSAVAGNTATFKHP